MLIIVTQSSKERFGNEAISNPVCVVSNALAEAKKTPVVTIQENANYESVLNAKGTLFYSGNNVFVKTFDNRGNLVGVIFFTNSKDSVARLLGMAFSGGYTNSDLEIYSKLIKKLARIGKYYVV